MSRYEVRLLFNGVLNFNVSAPNEDEAKLSAEEQYGGWLDNVNVNFDDCEKHIRKLTWRDNDDFASLLKTYGEPNYEFKNQPVWIFKEDAGVILVNGDLVGFTIDHSEAIFDVWHDGHFVDWGEEYYMAYFDYISERELLG